VNLTLQVVLTGLAAGSVYGLLAVGHTLVYRLTGIVHFALGDLVGLGVFIALFVTAGRGPVTAASASSWRFLLGLAVAVVAVAAVGSGSYFAVIHQYLARGSTLGWVAATVAIAFAVENVLAVVFPRSAYVVPDPIPFHRAGNEGIVSVAGATFQLRSLYVIALGLALVVVLTRVVQQTRFGRGLQAIAQDPEGARMVGIPHDRYVGLAFGLVGALAVVIAVAAAPSGPFAVTTGALLGVKGLVAAVVIGFGSPLRAYVSGLVLGLLEAAIASGELFGHGFGPSYREVLPIAIALVVLAFRARARTVEVE
jgi:branched-subunit amino acid ABC-type transport system permease component